MDDLRALFGCLAIGRIIAIATPASPQDKIVVEATLSNSSDATSATRTVAQDKGSCKRPAPCGRSRLPITKSRITGGRPAFDHLVALTGDTVLSLVRSNATVTRWETVGVGASPTLWGFRPVASQRTFYPLTRVRFAQAPEGWFDSSSPIEVR